MKRFPLSTELIYRTASKGIEKNLNLNSKIVFTYPFIRRTSKNIHLYAFRTNYGKEMFTFEREQIAELTLSPDIRKIEHLGVFNSVLY